MPLSKKQTHCPICKKPTNSQFNPFCSQRCKMIDLGHWLKGSYVIPGSESTNVEEEQKIEEQSSDNKPH